MIDDDPIENIEALKSPLNLVYKIEYYYYAITIIYFVDFLLHEVSHFSTFYSIIDSGGT